MSRNNNLGTIRRSQVIGYGPGAIIDFRAGAMGGGPVSVLAASLDAWAESAELSGLNDPQIVREPRLQKVLKKSYFRLPPVDEDTDGDFPGRALRGYRFPTWLQCPKCRQLRYAHQWMNAAGDPSRWCGQCSTPQQRVFVIPSRFVTACEAGHIDEFPWIWWLETRSSKPTACSNDAAVRCRLRIDSVGGTGLDALHISCDIDSCEASASLGGAFSEKGLAGLTCAGRQPWMTNDRSSCDAQPRTLQRGASNLYFPVTYSTLSIPPWSDEIQAGLGGMWSSIKAIADPELRKRMIEAIAEGNASVYNMTPHEFTSVLLERLRLDEEVSFANLRAEEFIKLCSTTESADFQVRQEKPPDELLPQFMHLARVERLREVRALTAFKRIYQPASVEEPGRGIFGKLQLKEHDWLPAIEVRGEGIFVALSYDAITQWSSNPAITTRVTAIDEAHAKEHARMKSRPEERNQISVAMVLIHSLAHSIIKRLSFECGYDVASLRERLYVDPEQKTAGLLIYTSTSDSDGTLGGLERQGKPDRFASIVNAAIRESDWCSSDPLCRSGISSLSESMNLAACHCCLLLPETCCETGNRFLDRQLLINSNAGEFKGFFTNDRTPSELTD